MNHIIIHIQQANKQCNIKVHHFPDGRNVIDINFSPCFPTEVDSLYEKIAAAVFNEVKKDEDDRINRNIGLGYDKNRTQARR